jgi:hypothetical protein
LWKYYVTDCVHFWQHSPDASRAVIVTARRHEYVVTVMD